MTFVHLEARDTVIHRLRSGYDVHVTGMVGAGRSSVLREVARSLRGAGTAVVELHGTVGGQSLPLAPLLAHPDLRPRGQSMRWGATEAADALGEALSGRGATVVVDDLDLLDAPTLSVLDTLSRRAALPVRLVTATSSRPDPDGPWAALTRRGTVVHLPPLDVNAIADLLAGELGGQVEGSTAALVTGRVGGNARAAIQLAVAAADAGVLAPVHGRWSMTSRLGALRLGSVLHGFTSVCTGPERFALDLIAWLGPVGAETAHALLDVPRLAALDEAGLLTASDLTPGRRLAVNPPALAQALRAALTPARRELLRLRVATLQDPDDPGEEAPVPLPPAAVEYRGPVTRDEHDQVTMVIEAAHAHTALLRARWSEHHDLASALGLLRLHLLDGLAEVDVEAKFARTTSGPDDHPDDVAAFAVLRAQWTASRGGRFRDGLMHDPGPTGRLVAEQVGEELLDLLDRLYGADDESDFPEEPAPDGPLEVPEPVRGLAMILQVQQAINVGQPDAALDLLGAWSPSERQTPYRHQLDALRGDALLLVDQIPDAIAWSRSRLSAAYDEQSCFGVRLAARGLATAQFLAGEHETALRTLEPILRFGRTGAAQSPFDERILGLAAVLHARSGHSDLAQAFFDELEATPRPYVPALDFMRPWARMELRSAAGEVEGAARELRRAGDELWERRRPVDAIFCWAMAPTPPDTDELGLLEEAMSSVQVPLMEDAFRVQRALAHGSAENLLEAALRVRGSGTLFTAAIAASRERAEREGTSLPPAQLEAVAAIATPPARPSPQLTSREREIVTLAREGMTNREIASRLFLSVRTVESHLYRSMQKLGVSQRSQLIEIAEV